MAGQLHGTGCLRGPRLISRSPFAPAQPVLLCCRPAAGMGAAYGTAKSGVGIASMGVMRPELVMKSIVPVVMAGVLGIYGLIIAVIISTGGGWTPADRAWWPAAHGAQGLRFPPVRPAAVAKAPKQHASCLSSSYGTHVVSSTYASLCKPRMQPGPDHPTPTCCLPPAVTPGKYTLFDGFAHLASGLSCGLAGLAAGMAIGIVGDAGVRCVGRSSRTLLTVGPSCTC